jgi:hypothetical protein
MITLRQTTAHRTPLDERESRLRNLYLETNITLNRQTPMPPAGLKPAIPESKQSQTQALHVDRMATGIGCYSVYLT